MKNGIEFCSEICCAAVCLQSNEQFVLLKKMLLAICNTQFNASAFIGNPTIQNKKKDIRLKNFLGLLRILPDAVHRWSFHCRVVYCFLYRLVAVGIP